MKKNKKGFFTRLFSSNLFLLVISFILSFVAWLLVSTNSTTDIKSVTIDNIPVKINIPESGYTYTYFLNKYSDIETDKEGNPVVSANVEGNAMIVGELSSDAISIIGKLNISQNETISPQEYKVHLAEQTGMTSNYSVEKITPSSFSIFVDQGIDKSFDIVNSCTFKNTDNTKYANITLSQSSINVSGPETLVNEIATVEVHGEITKEGSVKKDFIYKNKDGETLDDDYFTPSVDEIEVTTKLLPIATVNLKVEYKNKPSDVKAQANISPSAVRIAGEQAELDKYKKGLTVTTLDYADLKNSSFKEEFTITPPDKCKIIADEGKNSAPTKATVMLDLNSYSETTVSKKITYDADGYTFAFTPSEINIQLYGDETEIKDITSGDITLNVDIPDDFKNKIKELKSGESVSRQGIKLKPELSSDYSECWIYGSYTVDQVTVTKK